MLQDELLKPRGSSGTLYPKIVVVAAPKGGVGKTTISTSLLVSAKKAGLSVLGINMDEQASLESWGARRLITIDKHPSHGVLPIEVRRVEPGKWRDLEALTGYDLVVVDTPPGHGDFSRSLRAMCAVADLVLVPTSPNGVDLEEVMPFGLGLVANKLFFLLNRVNRRTKSYNLAKVEILEKGRLAPVDIPSLESIPLQYVHGLATLDFSEAGSEAFAALWGFIRGELSLGGVPSHG